MSELKERIVSKKAGCIVDIARIKNGLSQIKEWETADDCQYRDVKFNVIIMDPVTKQSMIGMSKPNKGLFYIFKLILCYYQY